MAESSISQGSEAANSDIPKVYGRLTVIGKPFLKEYGSQGRKRPFVECRCSCGTVDTFNQESLKRGDTRSCGCLQREEALTTPAREKRRQDG